MVLRGYPCDKAVEDLELISDLAWLEHEFLDRTLPEWLESAVRHIDTDDTNHTLDPAQTQRFSHTHVLITADAVDRLTSMHVLDGARYQTCRVVGVRDDWMESQWVPVHDFELAKMKLKFIGHFLPHRL